MTEDEFEKSLRRIVENIPHKKIDADMASRIVQRVTAERQSVPVSFFVQDFFKSLLSPWPADLKRKAAALGVVSIVAFNIGMIQETYAETGIDHDVISFVYGDFEDREAL